MAINTTCPACRKVYLVPTDQEGKRVQCIACREPFVVNGESDQEDHDLPVLREATRKSNRDARDDRREPPRKQARDDRAIDTTCPACRKSYRVPIDQEGRRVQCQECRESFVVKDRSERDAPRKSARDDRDRDPDRDRDRDRPDDRYEDEREDEAEAPSGGGGYVLIFLALGFLLVLMLGGGGVAVWLLMRSTPEPPVAVKDPPPAQIPDDPWKDLNKKPDPPKDDTPRDVASALDAVRHTRMDRKRQGVEFLLAAPVEPDRRDQVERALEPYEDDFQLGDLVSRTLKHWAPENEVPRQIRRLSSNRFGVADSAMEALSKSNEDRALVALASQLEVFGRSDTAARHLKATGPRCEKHVLPYLNHTNRHARPAARGVLESIGTSKETLIGQCLADVGEGKDGQKGDAALEMLAAMTPSKDVELNARVAKAFEEAAAAGGSRGRVGMDGLEKWATKQNVPALIELARQPALTDRVTKLLMKFTDDERLIPLFVSGLATTTYREASVKALQGFGEKAEDHLLPLLEPTHNNADARGLAVLLVAEFGTAKSLPGLNRFYATIPSKLPQKKQVQAVIDRVKEREKAKKDKDAPKTKDKG